MSTSLQTIRRLTIESRTIGVDESSQKLARLGQAHDGVAASSERAARQAGAYEKALANQQRSIDLANQAYIEMARDRAALASAMQQQVAANDNVSRSFHLFSVETAELTVHLKTAAVAAYALSPAVRAAFNPAIAIATTAAVKALGPAAVVAGGAVLSALSPLIAFATRLALPIYAVVGAFKAMNAITELGAEKLKELMALSDSAAAAGVGADYFQRQASGAEDLGLKIDLATQALKRFSDASESKLGGSGFENHLDALTKAGNFAENAGVAAYKQAATVEEKYRAAGEIVTIAIEKGERLAGLDLASKFLPPEMLERLRANGELLRDLQRAADEVRPVDIFTQEQIGYAAELNRRLEAANKVIAEGLKPLQRDLTMLGLNYQETWVTITEYMATGVKLANDFYSALKAIPGLFADMGNWSIWKKLTDFTDRLGLNSKPDGLGMKGEPGFGVDASQGSASKVQLTGWLQDANAVQTAMKNVNEISGKVFRDLSKPINSGAAKAATETKSALDSALESAEKYIQITNAAAASVGMGVAEQQKAKVVAELTAAAQRSGVTDLEKYKAQWDAIGTAAGEAAKSLALARIQSQIKFDRQTIGMSQEDVQIAQALRGVYPDIATAMNSAEAADMRLNNQLRESKELMSGFGNDLVGGLMRGEDAMKSLTGAASNLIQKLASKQLNKFMDGDFTGGNELGSMKGIGTIASAGLSGYQSGNAGTGALSGAMAGFAVGGPGGALLGGAAGLIGGVLGGSDKQRKQLEAAQKAWKDAGPAFEAFLTEMTGGTQGDLGAKIQSARATMTDLATKAWDAKDYTSLARIQNEYVGYTLREAGKVQAMFAATVQGLADGLGPDSPFFKAVSDVKSHLETVQKIIDDAVVSNTTTHMEGRVDADSAVVAAEKYLLSLLGTAPAMSEVETAMLTMQGTAKALQGALTQIGMSAGDAAVAIETQLAGAIDQLRTKFIAELTTSINDLSGLGYLNDITAAQALYETRVKDLAALGMGSGMALTELNLKLAEIASGANLTDDQLTKLANVFPALAANIMALTGGGALSVAAAQSLVDERQSDLRSAYEAQAGSLKEVISALDSSIRSLRKFKDSLALDNALSPLDPAQRFQTAQQQFQDNAALALSGDKDAIGKVEEVSRAYLEEARSYYGSSEAYYAAYNQTQAVLDQVLATAGVQLTEAQQQLAALDTQVGLLIDINTSVMSVADAVAALAAAQGQLTTANAVQTASQNTAYQQTGAGQISKMYQDVLGRDADAPGSSYWQSMMAGGIGGSDLLKYFVQAAMDRGGADASAAAQYKQLHGMLNGGIVGAFANGGMIGNGMYNVDSVIAKYAGGGSIALAGGEYVMPAPQTRQMLPQLEAMRAGNFSGGNDNSTRELISVLKSEIGALRSEVQRLTGVTAAGAQANVSATNETSSEVRRTAEKARQDRYRRAG